MTARYIVGDVLDVLTTLPDGSVDLVFTSPPFLALRSYLPADHPDKAKEIGSEPTPGEFIDALLDVTEALDRVLAPHGSLCFELGDTYSGSGGAGGDYGEDGLRASAPGFRGSAYAKRYEGTNGRSGPGRTRADRVGWPLDKSMCLIPEMYRMALAYGINPLTGRQTAPWRVRNVVRWHRPNPPVGALGDKFRPATSDVVIACKSRTRYFDLDAVRTEAIDQRFRTTNGPKQGDPAEVQTANFTTRVPSNPAGAPPLDTWVIPTQPYSGSHYATFPQALVVKPLLAMVPERVCMTCGEPSRRLTDNPIYLDGRGNVVEGKVWPSAMGERSAHAAKTDGNVTRTTRTTGWTDCGHDSYRPGVVLDPFAGSGTVLSVASGHGRDSIGIDLDERNAHLAQERVGMFLSVEYPAVVA